VTASAPPSSAVLARPCLVDGQGTAAVRSAVERVDRGLCLVVVGHLHKPEASTPTTELVDDHLATRHRPVGLEQLHEVVAGGVVGQVADVDVLTHDRWPCPESAASAPIRIVGASSPRLGWGGGCLRSAVAAQASGTLRPRSSCRESGSNSSKKPVPLAV